ncbi:unnamed protein product (macronuclear) [Paramecium tetraurelia]|uniref:RING-type domain-containing protein n=1 Tax=Paramecium tetraurelia TaxID=5888 RepID=A0E9H7_PARTE|nr:uncharacterized protein GSPATT00024675001 [Paramecium tetraurelia]CAK91944.1 unnamed protein product [Paramecium tetraurelia]|eukprot:XP_001459341.1 hypothetical protein (macronuclear) [Paramecium tetraurelia strain d4-2]
MQNPESIQQPLFNQECPYNSVQLHTIVFNNVWDYLVHLQKCHLLNQRSEIRQSSEYYMCHNCLKVFEEFQQLLDHTDSEETKTFSKVFDKMPGHSIHLSKQGKWDIIKLIENYKENYLAGKDSDTDNVFPSHKADPRLNTPRDTITKIKNLQIDKKEKLQLYLLQSKVLESAYYKLFNHYKDLSMINKEYPYKLTKDSFHQLMAKHNINLSQKLYEQTKVCEFMETALTNPEEHIMYMNRRAINKFFYLWILIHEDVNPFPGVQFQEPWVIIAIPTSSEQLLNLSVHKPSDNTDLLELQKQLNEQQEIAKQIEQEKSKFDQKKIEESKVLEQKILKLENLETQLRIQLTAQNKQQNDFESSILDLQDRSSKLDHYYQVQRVKIQNDMTNQSEFFKLADSFAKEKQKLLQRVEIYADKRNKIHYETQDLKAQITELGEKLRQDEQERMKSKTRRRQRIIQDLCIKCQKNTREIIHFPCQHFLFCTQCIIQGMVEKRQQCPLVAIGQCRDQRNLDKKFKTVRFSKND